MHRIFVAALAALCVGALSACGDPAPATQTEESHSETPEHHGEHDTALRLAPQARSAAKLETAVAGPVRLVERLQVYGSVQPNAERVHHVTARYPGIVRSVAVSVGDRIAKGQTLATVESNESLQVYPVSSPLSGVLTARMTNPGEQAGGSALFTVVDFSTVWVELSLFPRDRARVRAGQPVRVTASDDGLAADGEIVFISPQGLSHTQSVTARVVLDNADGRWTPGLYVQGHIAVGESDVALAVPAAALQTVGTQTVVFVERGDCLPSPSGRWAGDEGARHSLERGPDDQADALTLDPSPEGRGKTSTACGYEVRPITQGATDGRYVEILDGLSAGERVVTRGSFVLKAELGKVEAEHAH
ncbi:MAG: efflux RND transporter periplasmic adaptor subunit [Pseudomonadota bacterium]|nr:efflux RND transporter periplasmic adaptor subunit [Pseudomonadota bacterium]